MKYLVIALMLCSCSSASMREFYEGYQMGYNMAAPVGTTAGDYLYGVKQNEPAPAYKTVDYSCVNNCTAAGYQYGLCQNHCSY